MRVKPKKAFGQHFLKDHGTAKRIVDSLSPQGRYTQVLEIGPGMGILSAILFSHGEYETILNEVDREAVAFLKNQFPAHASQVVEGDFLQLDLTTLFDSQFAVIGNFPYNISTQILFRVLENKERIPEVVGMFQKEVGERIASPPGSKEYGILSVLMQAFYEVELVFLLEEKEFDPPPKVKSAVLHFNRKEQAGLPCDEKLFFKVVKAAFNQRRKKLSNALSHFILPEKKGSIPYLDKRAEMLSWEQFAELTRAITH